MAGVKDCPTCGLINPPEAQRCDCGYDFVSRTVEASYLGKRDPHADEPTTGETALVFLAPPFGLVLGLMARSRGRRRAGNRMIVASAALIVVPLAVVGLFLAFG